MNHVTGANAVVALLRGKTLRTGHTRFRFCEAEKAVFFETPMDKGVVPLDCILHCDEGYEVESCHRHACPLCGGHEHEPTCSGNRCRACGCCWRVLS